MARYVVGDVHGCYDALRRLLSVCGYRPGRDCLWFVGDLVNRGPNSLDVLDFVMNLNPRDVRFVLGNHDVHLIACAEGINEPDHGDTMEDVLSSSRLAEIVAWLSAQPLMVEQGCDLMVHAGWLPGWSIEEVRKESKLVSEILQSPADRKSLLKRRDSEDTMKSRGASRKRIDRARVALAALTRLRMCTPHGEAEFGFKGRPDQAPAGLLPWFRVEGHQRGEMRVIFGHWAALGFLLESRLLGLDTGCVWGGALTAIRLDDMRVTRVESI